MDVAKSIKDKERSGVSRVVVIEEGKDEAKFWEHLGGKGDIPEALEGGDDIEAEKALWDTVKLYQVYQVQDSQNFDLIDIATSRLMKEMLQESECYILDCVTEMYVITSFQWTHLTLLCQSFAWTGKKAPLSLKNGTTKVAKEMAQVREFWTAPISRELPGAETILFKEKFANWGSNLPIQMQQVAVGVNVAGAQKQVSV